MSDTLQIELCPETGICSVMHSGAGKIDLLPDEVQAIRDAGPDLEQVRAVLAESDSRFAAALSAVEVAQISKRLS